MASLPDTLALAAAGGLDLASAADIASNVMSGFNMMSGNVADNMKRVSDVMAAAASSANTDVNQLGQAMSYAAPVANAYGITLEESAAAIGMFSNAGIQGSRAGMTLKNVIAQLGTPVGQTKKKLEALGVSAKDVNPEVNSLADILSNLEKAGVQATDAIELVGREAGPGFASLLTIGSEELRKYTKELEGAEGAAALMAETMINNLGGDIKMLGSVWETFKLQLFFRQEGFMRDVVQGIASFVEKMTEAIPKVEKFIKANEGIFKGIALGVGILVGAIASIAAFKLAVAGIALLTSPIGLLVGSFIALGVGLKKLYDNSEPVRAFFEQFKEALLNTREGVSDFIAYVTPVIGVLVEKFFEGFERIKEIVNNLVERFVAQKERFGNIFTGIIEIFTRGKDLVIDVLTTLWNVAGPLLSVLGNALAVVGDVALLLFEYIIVPGANLAMAAIQYLWNKVGPLLELLAAAFEFVSEVVRILWEAALKPLAEFLGGAFKMVVEGATIIIDGIGNSFSVVGTVVESVTGWIKTFSDFLSKIKIPNWLSNFIGGGSVNIAPDGSGGAKASSHYHGLDNVPYDGYMASLHKGERVLTAQENKELSSGESTSNKSFVVENITINAGGNTDGQSLARSIIAALADELETEVSLAT